MSLSASGEGADAFLFQARQDEPVDGIARPRPAGAPRARPDAWAAGTPSDWIWARRYGVGQAGRAGGDPLLDDFDLGVRQFAGGRHFQFAGLPERGDDQAVLRIARHDRRTAGAAAEHGRSCGKRESAGRRLVVMAGRALFCEKCYGRLFGGRKRRDEQPERKESDQSAASLRHGVTTILSLSKRYRASGKHRMPPLFEKSIPCIMDLLQP